VKVARADGDCGRNRALPAEVIAEQREADDYEQQSR
jgi:hypothetical protein